MFYVLSIQLKIYRLNSNSMFYINPELAFYSIETTRVPSYYALMLLLYRIPLRKD